jgi:hypothetical protein
VNRGWYRDSLRRPRTLAKASTLVLLCALLLAFAREDGADVPGVLVSGAEGVGIGLGFVAPLWGLFYLTLGPRVRRLYRQMRTRDGAFRWRWNSEGVRLSTSNGAIQYRWEELQRVAKGRHSFLLFFNERQYLALPREALDAGQARSFVAAASPHFPGLG